jgi:hypothetical protein
MGWISRTGWKEGWRQGGLITTSTVNGAHITRVDSPSSNQERVSVRPLRHHLRITRMFAFRHLHNPPTSFTGNSSNATNPDPIQTPILPHLRRGTQQRSQIDPDATRLQGRTNVLDGFDPRGVDEEQDKDARAQRARPFIRVELPETCGVTSENVTGPSVGTPVDESPSVGTPVDEIPPVSVDFSRYLGGRELSSGNFRSCRVEFYRDNQHC